VQRVLTGFDNVLIKTREALLRAGKAMLLEKHGIDHATLQPEPRH
jgi:beta-phosphoglucomutase-like phosphatase (HAD superfamily)